MEPDSDARLVEEVVAAWRACSQALTDGDATALAALLDDGFTLTHLTGYVQPKREWLDQVRAGELVYYGLDEKSVEVDVTDEDTARLIGLVVNDMSFSGERGSWNVQFTFDYARRNGAWTALRAVGTSW